MSGQCRGNVKSRSRASTGRLATAFLACLAACAPPARVNVPELARQALDAARIEPLTEPSTSARAAGPRVIVREDGRCQSVEFAHDGHALVLVTYAVAPTDDERRVELDANFAIESVAARRLNELFVAGTTSAGRTRIERWMVRDGADGATDALTSRDVLLDDLALGGVRLLACDPGGRFVLALARSGAELVQVPLDGLPPARYRAELTPALREANALFCGEHVSGERVFAFETAGGTARDRAVFVDRDDDGGFDDVRDVDARGWSELGYDGAVWLHETLVTAR